MFDPLKFFANLMSEAEKANKRSPKPRYDYVLAGHVPHKRGKPVPLFRAHLIDRSKYSGAALREIRKTHR